MSSTLACVGFETDDLAGLEKLLDRLIPEVVGSADGADVVRFTDDSGARVVVTVRDGETLDLVPSYAAPPGARLDKLARHGGYAMADVVDADGEVLTRLACDLEQVRHLGGSATGPLEATVLALAVRVTVHDDDAAFAGSDDSRLGDPEPGSEPLRFAAESFLAYGLFGESAEADPVAFLAGTVLACETVENHASEQRFHVASVRTAGFTASVCLAVADHPEAPVPGNVVAGACYLVVDAPSLWQLPSAPPRRRRWGRR